MNKYSNEIKKSLSKKQIAKGLRQILYPDLDDGDEGKIKDALWKKVIGMNFATKYGIT